MGKNSGLNTTKSSASEEHFNGPLLVKCRSPQYKVLQTNKFTVKLSDADCHVQLVDNSIAIIRNIAYYDNDLCLVGQKYLCSSDFFDKPCSSSRFGIFLLDKSDLGTLEVFMLIEIKNKVVFLPLMDSNRAVVFPLLHST